MGTDIKEVQMLDIFTNWFFMLQVRKYKEQSYVYCPIILQIKPLGSFSNSVGAYVQETDVLRIEHNSRFLLSKKTSIKQPELQVIIYISIRIIIIIIIIIIIMYI